MSGRVGKVRAPRKSELRSPGRRSTELPGLIEQSELSHHPERDGGGPERLGNCIVHGNHLKVLTALEPWLSRSVKLAYVDPPYNTGSTFDHYDDSVRQDVWLSRMRELLVLVRRLLRGDGLVFVQIDDREAAALQVLMDEIFGRACRVNNIVVKMSELSGVKMSHAQHRLPKLKEWILVYGATPGVPLRTRTRMKPADRLERYLRYYTHVVENPDAPVESWRVVRVRDHLASHGLPNDAASIRAFQLRERHRVVYRTNNRFLSRLRFDTPIAPVTSPRGIDYVWWEGRQMLFLADHCEESLGDLWTDLSTINVNREGGVSFPNGKKPEALLARIVDLATEPGDCVLDPCAGSGTTGAVAHKLGRHWVLVEQGLQARTHIVPRLRRVVDGSDRTGVRASDAGKDGGFRFYRWVPGRPPAHGPPLDG